MAENTGIARPYAQAAFEIAREAGQLPAWSDMLHAGAEVVSDNAVVSLIDAPQTNVGKLLELIVGICTAAAPGADSAQVNNFIRLLQENGRLLIIDEIAQLFDKLKADVENSIDVVLTAAAEVDQAQKTRIAEALKQRFGREVNLHFKLDENLIGGAMLQADDLVIDGTVRTGLEKLASTLMN